MPPKKAKSPAKKAVAKKPPAAKKRAKSKDASHCLAGQMPFREDDQRGNQQTNMIKKLKELLPHLKAEAGSIQVGEVKLELPKKADVEFLIKEIEAAPCYDKDKFIKYRDYVVIHRALVEKKDGGKRRRRRRPRSKSR